MFCSSPPLTKPPLQPISHFQNFCVRDYVGKHNPLDIIMESSIYIVGESGWHFVTFLCSAPNWNKVTLCFPKWPNVPRLYHLPLVARDNIFTKIDGIVCSGLSGSWTWIVSCWLIAACLVKRPGHSLLRATRVLSQPECVLCCSVLV